MTLENKIIILLKSLPTLHDNESQRAFIYQAGLDPQLQEQILIGRPPAEFVPLLVSRLFKYGELADGHHAIEAIIETAKYHVGIEGKRDCNVLLQELHEQLGQTDPILMRKNKTRHLKKMFTKILQKYYAFFHHRIWARVCIASGFILIFIFIYSFYYKERTDLSIEDYHKVDIILPSHMIGAKIIVDDNPAIIYEENLDIITILVNDTPVIHQIIVAKDAHECTQSFSILQGENLITPCM